MESYNQTIKNLAQSKYAEKKASNHANVIKRINEIIESVNEDNMGGRAKNYIKGGKLKSSRYRPLPEVYNYMDPQNGLMHISQSPTGYSLEASMYGKGLKKKKCTCGGELLSLSYGGDGTPNIPVGGLGSPNIPVGGLGYPNIPVGGRHPRKTRSDKGTKKTNNWVSFVKAVSKKYRIPYNQAMKTASELKSEGYTMSDL